MDLITFYNKIFLPETKIFMKSIIQKNKEGKNKEFSLLSNFP